ncbi:MAG: dihydroorotate dehydrogenase electron transfer subunit [Candidatus Geothermarchaeota archaeon]
MYFRGFISNIYVHWEQVKSFYLTVENYNPEVKPGMFLMIWVLGYEEIPISPSLVKGNVIRLTVMNRGPTTNRIHRMAIGDKLYIRGPYGRGFDLTREGRYMLVGGGYGASPLIYAAHVLKNKGFDLTYVEGVKTASRSLFISEAKSLGVDVALVTEDGSSEHKGLVTDYVEKVIHLYDYVLGCGPEEMLKKLLKICHERGVKCQLSVERIIKCGIGICGSCSIGRRGLLVCKDGPVFYGDELVSMGFLDE